MNWPFFSNKPAPALPRLVIAGGVPLKGEIPVFGAKNAALKMMAAALLTKDDVILHNVPDIRDIQMMAGVLESLGGVVKRENHTLTINCRGLKSSTPNKELSKHFRASIVVAGPLLASAGKVELYQPGGCLIGARPIDFHLNAFRQFGGAVKEKGDCFQISGPLKPSEVTLDDLTVTGTENTLMAAAGINGQSTIRQCVVEPEIGDLLSLLSKMGAKVTGTGTSVVKIEGSGKLHGAEHTVMPDRIEAGTFLIAAAATKGEVLVTGCRPHHLDAVLRKLTRMGVSLTANIDSIAVKPTKAILPVNITTNVYPGFPTDLQAPMAVLLTQAEGTSRVFETIFEGRLGYAEELKKMGAHLSVEDAHTLLVYGPTPLHGRSVDSVDLRAGATLVIAALLAKGETILDHAEILDRGYEKLEERLSAAGAQIERLGVPELVGA